MQTYIPKVAFLTLGCAKNEVDSDYMRCLVEQAGYAVLDAHIDMGIDAYSDADLVILNTCAFLEIAVSEGIDTIFDILDLPKFKAGDAHLIVCGCMPARYGEALAQELPEVDAFLSFSDEKHIVDVLQSHFNHRVSCCDMKKECISSRTLGNPSSYVKISDGCSRFCSYCMIPYIRGAYHSRPFGEIFDEVEQLVSGGTKEIILIAQDTGIWGNDLDVSADEPHNLATLLKALSERFSGIWFRVLYTQPEAINSELLDVLRSHDNICNYLDIPMQHVSAHILQDMNRSGDPESLLQLVANTREYIPSITLRTTFMTGFPGETEEDVSLLEDFIEKVAFNYAGIFAFSPEDGTPAALMDHQISDDEKQERAQVIRDCADISGFKYIEDMVGQIVEVLVCGYEYDLETGEKFLYGRTQFQAPDVDGITYLEEGEIGSFVLARVIDSCCYDLFTEAI